MHTQTEKGRAPLQVDMESIKPLFGLPQKDAATMLGISLTALKQVCRKLGVQRWPYWRRKKSEGTGGRYAGVQMSGAGSLRNFEGQREAAAMKIHAHTHAYPHARTHARTQAHTRTHVVSMCVFKSARIYALLACVRCVCVFKSAHIYTYACVRASIFIDVCALEPR